MKKFKSNNAHPPALREWSDYREYIFIMANGQNIYEFCKSTSDVHAFQKMHGAKTAMSLSHHEQIEAQQHKSNLDHM